MRSMGFVLLLAFSFSSLATEKNSCSDFLSEKVGGWLDEFQKEWGEQKTHFSSKQVKTWDEALEHLIEDLDEIGESSSKKDQLLKSELEKAVRKLPMIRESFKAIESEDRKAGYFKEAFEAVWATLSVHSHELVDARTRDKDYSRYFLILKSISDFDPEKPKFSFYKVRRAVEGRFSLKEFNNCKLD